MKGRNYIRFKCSVLFDLGLTNVNAVKEYLTSETEGIKDNYKKEMKIDRICNDLVDAYFNGDRTFVQPKLTGKECHKIIKAKYINAETLYEDVIIDLVGKEGLNLLRKNHLIETCAMIDGRKLYAI